MCKSPQISAKFKMADFLVGLGYGTKIFFFFVGIGT